METTKMTSSATGRTHSLRRLGGIAVVCALAVTVAACGDSDDSGGTDSDSPPVTTSDVTDSGASDLTTEGAGTDALDTLIADADVYDQVSTPSGGRVVVTVVCESQMGGNIVSVGSSGVAEGVYEGEFEPSAGGTLTLQVLADGRGMGARQTTLEDPSYTITFPDLDGGIELTVAGCAS
jgi:hypothetical protein